ncbi:hypothetical protein PVNG_06151 [Plasmodium vivax North Korean]|uniref:Variable surface protein Vir10 n=1 Tax=Plasmodium vivax North Korean TaxID=1035514 RepID=A0A0J9TM22_PLAVI|nr:hypothetical protein PVNG_06151 [Plasmodium vivax North Korean]
MASLRNYNLPKSVNFTVFLKKITFIFLSWSCLAYIDVGLFPKSLEIVYAHDKRWNLKFKRLLARNAKKKEFEHTRLREKLPDRRAYKSESIVSDELSIYPRVKGKASNNIDTYMKNYKNRYMKKKGLSKLDCYYENKVFGKFCHICDIAEKMNYDKKRSKSFFLKKYGIAFFLFALIPALGLIFPILFGFRDYKGVLGLCPGGTGNGSHWDADANKHKEAPDIIKNCSRKWMYDNKDTIEKFGNVSYIFSFIMITIVILLIIYMFIKVIKYEKIKAGKGKMNIKEYCRFCKDIF